MPQRRNPRRGTRTERPCLGQLSPIRRSLSRRKPLPNRAGVSAAAGAPRIDFPRLSGHADAALQPFRGGEHAHCRRRHGAGALHRHTGGFDGIRLFTRQGTAGIRHGKGNPDSRLRTGPAGPQQGRSHHGDHSGRRGLRRAPARSDHGDSPERSAGSHHPADGHGAAARYRCRRAGRDGGRSHGRSRGA